MYTPKRYQSDSDKESLDYIRKNSFGTLVGVLNEEIIASHIPLYLSEERKKNVLFGHISVQNELKDCLDGSQSLMAIFMDTHSYISSSWYSHIDVPTWNYIAIHVYGRPRVLDEMELRRTLADLVEKYESGRQPRFHISDMPEKMMDAQVKGIIGFELEIERMEATYKLSQNKKNVDIDTIINHLERQQDSHSKNTAKAMLQRRKK